jgi:hypothetical protein
MSCNRLISADRRSVKFSWLTGNDYNPCKDLAGRQDKTGGRQFRKTFSMDRIKENSRIEHFDGGER